MYKFFIKKYIKFITLFDHPYSFLSHFLILTSHLLNLNPLNLLFINCIIKDRQYLIMAYILPQINFYQHFSLKK